MERIRFKCYPTPVERNLTDLLTKAMAGDEDLQQRGIWQSGTEFLEHDTETWPAGRNFKEVQAEEKETKFYRFTAPLPVVSAPSVKTSTSTAR